MDNNNNLNKKQSMKMINAKYVFIKKENMLPYLVAILYTAKIVNYK